MKISVWAKNSGLIITSIGWFIIWPTWTIIFELAVPNDIMVLLGIWIIFISPLLGLLVRTQIRVNVYDKIEFRRDFIRNKSFIGQNLIAGLTHKTIEEGDFLSLSKYVRSGDPTLDILILGVCLENSKDLSPPLCFDKVKSDNQELYLACYYTTKLF